MPSRQCQQPPSIRWACATLEKRGMRLFSGMSYADLGPGSICAALGLGHGLRASQAMRRITRAYEESKKLKVAA